MIIIIITITSLIFLYFTSYILVVVSMSCPFGELSGYLSRFYCFSIVFFFRNIDEAVQAPPAAPNLTPSQTPTQTPTPTPTHTPTQTALPNNTLPLDAGPSTQATPVEQQQETDLVSVIGPYPYNAPQGFKWVPNGWKLVPVSTDFKTLFLNKIKPVTEKSTKKRTKLDLRAKVNSSL